MALISDSFLLAELRKPGSEVQPVLTITFPDKTRRYASAGQLHLTSEGYAEAKVISWGSLRRGVSRRDYSLDAPTMDVTITDTDHDFAKLLMGASGYDIYDVPASVRLVYPRQSTNGFTLWSGRLQSWEQQTPLTWTFTLAPKDEPLRRDAAPKAHLNQGMWSSVHPTAANLRAPIIYGRHSSVSVTNEGFLDAVFVDTRRFRYLVGVGVLKSIDCVYSDGAPVAPSGYAISYPVVDGRIYTALDFASTQDAATISVDCSGLTDAGAGGGTLIENPARAIENLLHSFVFGDWRQGTWLEDTTAPAPLDADSLDALSTWFDNRGWRCSKRFPCPQSGLDMIAGFLESHEIRAWWTNDGTIAFGVEDPAAFSYADAPVIRTSEQSSFGYSFDNSKMTDQIQAEYVHDAIGGQYSEQIQARDVSVVEELERRETLERTGLEWSAAFVVDAAPTIGTQPLPSTVSGLQYWYRAGAESYNDGDAVGTVTDQSGSARHLTQAAASKKLTFRTGRINGSPSYEFDGEDDYVEGSTAWTTMHPAGTWHWFAVIKPHKIEAAEEETSGFVGHHVHGPSNQDFEGLHVGNATGGKVASTTLATAAGTAQAVVGVNENEWVIVQGWATTAAGPTYELHLRIGRGEVETVAAGARAAGSGNIRWGRIGDEAEQILASQAPPPDSEEEPPASRYFKGEVAELFGYNKTLNDREQKVCLEYLEARYRVHEPAGMELAKDVASRRLWATHRPIGRLDITVPLWTLDIEVLDRVWIESPLGPHEDGEGWGRLRWQRRPFSVQETEVDLDSRVVHLSLLDRRPLDALIWDTAWSRVPLDRDENGTARFTPGVDRTYARPSNAWPASPQDPDIIVRVPLNAAAVDRDGELFERNAWNYLPRSSLASGTTGLTLTGTGTNGSAIEADDSTLLFDPEVSAYSLKFTAGSPHSADLVAQWPDTSATGSSGWYFRLSIDHLDDSGATLYYRLQRVSDTQFWNDSSATWGSTVDNAIPNSTTRARHVSKAIDTGATSAFRLEILQQSGGTASRVNRVFHVQFEDCPFATSRIVTDDAVYRRQDPELKVYQESATQRCYWEEQGTVLVEVIPHWSTADLITDTPTIYYITYGAEPVKFYDWLYYDAANTRWVFERYVDQGVTPATYRAILSGSVTRGTTYRVAARWTGVEAELGLTAYTLSLFVNGTQGTDDVAEDPTALITYDNEFLRWGAKIGSDSDSWSGHIRRRLVRPYPMTNAEIARFEA